MDTWFVIYEAMTPFSPAGVERDFHAGGFPILD